MPGTRFCRDFDNLAAQAPRYILQFLNASMSGCFFYIYRLPFHKLASSFVALVYLLSGIHMRASIIERNLLSALLFFSWIFRLILIFAGRFRIQFPAIAVPFTQFLLSLNGFIIRVG